MTPTENRAAGAAEETVEAAEQRGQRLDIDEVYLSIKASLVQPGSIDLLI